jgi:hypothetical protein
MQLVGSELLLYHLKANMMIEVIHRALIGPQKHRHYHAEVEYFLSEERAEAYLEKFIQRRRTLMDEINIKITMHE